MVILALLYVGLSLLDEQDNPKANTAVTLAI